MMAETGEMVGASFLSICVTVGAASFGPPKARNLLSSALPFNVARTVFLLVGMAATCSLPHLEAHPKTPNHMAQQRNPPGAHLEFTLHCMGERHREPTGTCMAEREEPTRSPREPTGNLLRTPPQTVSKTA